MSKKRIVIIDDHPIVRQGFSLLINQEQDLEVVGEAEDTITGYSLIVEKSPDLALVDLSLKDSNGLELIKDVIRVKPDILLLVVSLHDENIYAERALRAGARGFIMKAEATESVMTAIRQVLAGGIYLSGTMRSRMLEQIAVGGGSRKGSDPVAVLSDRELEVFSMIGQGLKTKAIAENLGLSVKTIETYKAHLKLKLHLNDHTELIQKAVEWCLHCGGFN